MHKESDIAMTEWEQHFQKLQHGLIFDKNNPDVTERSKDEKCNKKLIQNDAGSSQNKLHDRHKTHSLDECVLCLLCEKYGTRIAGSPKTPEH